MRISHEVFTIHSPEDRVKTRYHALPMAEQFALEATGVHKRYGDRAALSGIDLVARPGQLHGLLGPNGAGKTTLMRVALGLVRCDAGTVDLLGHRVSSTAGPIPDGVAGFVEAPAFYPYLSGRRNLQLLGRLDGNRKSRNALQSTTSSGR